MKLERKCAICGEDDERVIHNHHINEKETVPLCANCHNIEHRSRVENEEGYDFRDLAMLQHIIRCTIECEENEEDFRMFELLHEILENYPSPIKIDNPNRFVRLKLAIGGEMSFLERRIEIMEKGDDS